MKDRVNRMLYGFLARAYWKKTNKHNFTWIKEASGKAMYDFLKRGGVTVGSRTYGQINIGYTLNKNEKLVIGNNCSLSSSCKFLLGGEHDYKCISTYPFVSKIGGYETEVLCKGPIVVDDEVWIGDDALIMSGVHLGKGAVVAARSVVTKDVPPYAIVAGNPARILKYRFSEDIINRLMDVDIELTSVNEAQKRALTTRLTNDNLNEIIKDVCSD